MKTKFCYATATGDDIELARGIYSPMSSPMDRVYSAILQVKGRVHVFELKTTVYFAQLLQSTLQDSNCP